jgi:hypothetical protein
MRYFLILSVVVCFGSQNLFAQDEDYYFSFGYKLNQKEHTFKLFGLFEGLKNVPDAVQKTYNAKQKRADASTYSTKIIYDTLGKAERYYYIRDYFKDKPAYPEMQHWYDAKGKWLYSLIPVPESEKQFWSSVQGLIKKYVQESAENDLSTISAYKIKSDAKKSPQYVLEFNLVKLKPAYMPKGEYDEYGFRVLLDTKYKVTHEYNLYGAGSAVSELNLIAPIFWK